MTVPGRDWYDRPVLDVARDLLGATLTRRSGRGDVVLRVTEVEAYDGERDPGSHAYRGRTARNGTMFGEPGHLYVYRHLGLHHCVNVVCGPVGRAAAVLLRAGEVVGPDGGAELARRRRLAGGVVRHERDLARGPARLTVALGLDLADDGAAVTRPGGEVVLEASAPVPASAVRTGPRVGVSGEGGRADLFGWRFWLDGEPTVSDYRAAPARRPARTRSGAAGTAARRQAD